MSSPVAPAESGLSLLRRYQWSWFRPDVVGGLTVGAMLVPQSMAYAELAGIPAAVGLYAALLSPVAYALVGTSRHLGTGPEPGTALLAATGVAAVIGPGADPARSLTLMTALAILVAVVSGLAWVLRLGFLADMLSKPVLVGYITGVGLVLLSSQLRAISGVPVESGDFFPRIVEFVGRLDQFRGFTVSVGLGSLALLLGLRRWAPKVPGALVVVIAATAASRAFDLGARGDPTIGAIPAGLPAIAIPDVPLADVWALVPAAIGIALVGYSDNVLTGRAISSHLRYRIDPSRELAGLSAANLASGLLQGMPVSSSASRTAVPASLGTMTSLVSIVASGFVLVTLVFARGLLEAVPRAALAAVIVAAAFTIIDIEGFRELWRLSPTEFLLAGVTSFGVMLFDVLTGVLLAITLSIVIALSRMARPADAVLGSRGDLDGWVAVQEHGDVRTLPGLLVYRFDAPLFFANTERFRSRLLQILDENPGDEQWVILDLEGVGDVDTTAIDMLRQLCDELDRLGVEVVAVARGNSHALKRLRRARMLEPSGVLRAFPTINGAVRAFQSRPHQSELPE